MSEQIYIVSKFNDGHMNKVGDTLIKKANGYFWNPRLDRTVNVHKDNVISLSSAMKAKEDKARIREYVESRIKLCDNQIHKDFIIQERAYMNILSFIDSLEDES